jgi:YidC/Oxa1 family membrane protein insertase
MDKKNTFMGLAFIVAGIGFMIWQTQQVAEQAAQESAQPPAARPEAEPSTEETAKPSFIVEQSPIATQSAGQENHAKSLFAEFDSTAQPDEKITLSNGHIAVHMTSRGGAIQEVEFLQTKRGERDDFVFNELSQRAALELSLPNQSGELSRIAQNFELESATASRAVYLLNTDEGLQIRRIYELAGDESAQPYVIQHRTQVLNTGAESVQLSDLYFNLGTVTTIASNALPSYLNVGYFNGDAVDFTAVDDLTGSSGILGFGAKQPQSKISLSNRMEWTSVKNQFFTAILSADSPGKQLTILPVAVNVDAGLPNTAIQASVGYALGSIAPGEQSEFNGRYYVGPKEFKRLQALGNQQDLVMEFGFLAFISKLLLSFMYAIYWVVPSWGWSIVIMTICIKLIFWPLTAKASRSQKRMAKIQAPMAALKEKYKDNPRKMQEETLKLFREHQVNPVAGCLPILIQMPIFLGLFYMLRSAAELRHEPFLWVADLSQPDTLFEIAGFPINLLPLIMGVTMFFQMSMMPVSPTADPMQQKIFKFLPFVFLIFLYTFSAGLVLYWTVQNILTIVQQKITNLQMDKESDLTPVVKHPNATFAKKKTRKRSS